MNTSCRLLEPNPYMKLLWLPALLLTANDACAWGLYTHVWFAQALLWLVPLADPRMRRAAQRLPRLVMAGSCLPDLALVGGLCGTSSFDNTHEWERAAALLAKAESDEQRALALGYTSHLLTDIFAHNHFVPVHKSVWADLPLVTHAMCEWALDYQLAKQMFVTPSALLKLEEDTICAWLERDLGCAPGAARRSVWALGRGDAVLRASGLPALSSGVGRLLDLRMTRRFNHYLSQTTRRLEQINRVIDGEQPHWVANPERHSARTAIAGEKTAKTVQLRMQLKLPGDVFKARPLVAQY